MEYRTRIRLVSNACPRVHISDTRTLHKIVVSVLQRAYPLWALWDTVSLLFINTTSNLLIINRHPHELALVPTFIRHQLTLLPTFILMHMLAPYSSYDHSSNAKNILILKHIIILEANLQSEKTNVHKRYSQIKAGTS